MKKTFVILATQTFLSRGGGGGGGRGALRYRIREWLPTSKLPLRAETVNAIISKYRGGQLM